MDWLLYIVAGVAASLALFLSKPERKKLAILTAALILLPAIWQAYRVYDAYRAELELSKYMTNRLSSKTNHFLTLLRDMIYYSSDGWLPESETDFFSQHAAEVICCHLNLDNDAPVLPAQSWRHLFAQNAREYKETIHEVLTGSKELLSADFVRNLSLVEGSLMLGVLPRIALIPPRIYSQYGGKRPPLLCCGDEASIAEEMGHLLILFENVRNLEKSFDIVRDWRFLKMNDDNRWPKKLLGKDRLELIEDPGS